MYDVVSHLIGIEHAGVRKFTWTATEDQGYIPLKSQSLWMNMDGKWMNIPQSMAIFTEEYYLDYLTKNQILGCVLQWGRTPANGHLFIGTMMINQWMEWGFLFSRTSRDKVWEETI